jgi:hypothetical protein
VFVKTITFRNVDIPISQIKSHINTFSSKHKTQTPTYSTPSLQLTDRAQPVEKHIGVMADTYGLEAGPMTAQMFGMAAREHMEKYGL